MKTKNDKTQIIKDSVDSLMEMFRPYEKVQRCTF